MLTANRALLFCLLALMLGASLSQRSRSTARRKQRRRRLQIGAACTATGAKCDSGLECACSAVSGRRLFGAPSEDCVYRCEAAPSPPSLPTVPVRACDINDPSGLVPTSGSLLVRHPLLKRDVILLLSAYDGWDGFATSDWLRALQEPHGSIAAFDLRLAAGSREPHKPAARQRDLQGCRQHEQTRGSARSKGSRASWRRIPKPITRGDQPHVHAVLSGDGYPH